MTSFKGQPVLILTVVAACLVLPTLQSIQQQYTAGNSVEQYLLNGELRSELEQKASNIKLQDSTNAACGVDYVPPVETTQAASYYFWDITGAPFNKSVYTPYVTQVLAGLKLTYYFEYSTECTQQLQNLFSQIYYTVKNGTCNDAAVDPLVVTKYQIFYASQVLSTEFANSFQNCFLLGNSMYKVSTTRLGTFSDFTDFYTSFLFNLLSQSLAIKNIATNINTYYTDGKYPELSGEIAKLIRIIVDFDSSNAAGLFGLGSKQTNKESILLTSEEKELTSTDELLQSSAEKDIKLTDTTVNPWTTIKFTLSDIFNIPLGILEGSMAAIESNQYSFYCSKNATQSRKNIYQMTSYLSSGQYKDGVAQFYQFLQKSDDMVINCGESIFNANFPILFSTTAANSPNSYWGENFLQNILYNVGFQFTDVLDLIFIDPANTDPFWYYVSYRAGDFIVRFIFRETNA